MWRCCQRAPETTATASPAVLGSSSSTPCTTPAKTRPLSGRSIRHSAQFRSHPTNASGKLLAPPAAASSTVYSTTSPSPTPAPPSAGPANTWSFRPVRPAGSRTLARCRRPPSLRISSVWSGTLSSSAPPPATVATTLTDRKTGSAVLISSSGSSPENQGHDPKSICWEHGRKQLETVATGKCVRFTIGADRWTELSERVQPGRPLHPETSRRRTEPGRVAVRCGTRRQPRAGRPCTDPAHPIHCLSLMAKH